MAEAELLPFIILLAFSPLIGYLVLRLLYADIRMYIPAERWILSTIVGFAPFLPAAFLGFILLAKPNITHFIAVYSAAVFVDSAVVKFYRDKRVTHVGMPKGAIQYTLQALRSREGGSPEARAKRVEMLTQELEKSLSPRDKDLQNTISRLRDSLRGTGAATGGEAKTRERKAGREAWGGVDEEPRSRAEKPAYEKKVAAGRNEEDAKRLLAELREKLSKGRTEGFDTEKKERIAVVGGTDEEKVKKLLQNLESEVKRQSAASEESIEEDAVGKEVVEKLVESLREAGEKEEKEYSQRRSIGKQQGVWKDELIKQSSKSARRPSYGGEDVMRGMVDDIRTQLLLFKRKEGGEGGGIKRVEPKKKWYDESGVAKETAASRGVPEGGFATPSRGSGGTGEELFESELDFGNLGGVEDELTKGLEEEFGEGSFEGLDAGELSELEGGYDGMMVNVGATPGACPRCTKKGTTIVFCPSCAHPFCSNCAKGMRAKSDSVGYTCPNCGNVFAVRRHH